MNSLSVKNTDRLIRTDFYSVIPIPENKYVLLIEDTVIGVYEFPGIEEAEEYLIYNYYRLKEEAMGVKNK